jgi:hypothetical protein
LLIVGVNVVGVVECLRVEFEVVKSSKYTNRIVNVTVKYGGPQLSSLSFPAFTPFAYLLHDRYSKGTEICRTTPGWCEDTVGNSKYETLKMMKLGHRITNQRNGMPVARNGSRNLGILSPYHA